MKDASILHNLNPQGRFTSRAEDYAKYRPGYPSEVIDRLVAELRNRSGIAADIGAGTGISSRLLADRGIKVMAIEPNEAMRQIAQSHPLVEFSDGNAENTKLADASVDLITCFQSFHWFDPKPTLKEFARILKPQGKIALIWNDRDVDGEDDFTREHDRLITEASNNSPIHNRLDGKSNLQISSLFSQVEQHIFSYQQTFNLKGLIGLAMSASYLPQTGKAHQKLVTDLTNLYQKYQKNTQDLVFLKYNTSLYLAEL